MSIVWQRGVDSGTFVWVRPDDVIAIGDELVDLATGAGRDESPWPFLESQPWSRQRWESRLADVFHLGDGGLALARGGGMLTCLSLPGVDDDQPELRGVRLRRRPPADGERRP